MQATADSETFPFFFIIEVYASLIMALVGVEIETLISEPDTLTIRPPPCARLFYISAVK